MRGATTTPKRCCTIRRGPVDSRIRQYFQAAVLEFHPESSVAPVKLRLLGDTLRNRKYPHSTWERYLGIHVEAGAFRRR